MVRQQLTRRKLMTALGASAAASVAGCLNSEAPATDPTNESENEESPPTTTTTTADSTADPDGTMTDGSTVIQPAGNGPIQRIEVAAAPDDSPFQHNLDFLAHPTEDDPARLRLSLTNADDTEHTIQTNNFGLPFPARVGKAVDGDATLVLSPDSDAERRDGCWRDYPKTLPKVETKTLPRGETLSATYALVNDMDADACWPTGSYRFSQQYEVDPEAGGIKYGWWFAVSV